jgi:MoaA/NifB/PqqE/SkfB family radical SAM enzyme/protein-L-isoaspartate O-methyltransferase
MRGDDFFMQVSRKPPFTRLHPKVASFFKDYFSKEKVIRFGDRFVVNTHFPPYPSGAFDNLAEKILAVGDARKKQLYSVTLAVTNRCGYNCWHCYNAGRSQTDIPMEVLKGVVDELQTMGAVMVTLTGGEPLLRDDLPEIAEMFGEQTCLILGTTGAGLTPGRAQLLKDRGLFGVGISLDSTCEEEHDRLRGEKGAFRTALRALRVAREYGLYPYVVSVATRDLLRPDRFMSFMRFAGVYGALEVHLLEPIASGRLAGQTDVLLGQSDQQLILDYQEQVAEDDNLPILSSYAYLESAEAFGCGAGLTHLYIDGSGEVCPCQLVPLSFGNVAREPLARILDRMGDTFREPRDACVARLLAEHLPDGPCPSPPEVSTEICERCLPRSRDLPRFFRIRYESQQEVGRKELKAAYDRVHGDYDDFWLTEASKPVGDLVLNIKWRGTESVFEAGCGTGYATALLAERAKRILAADLSEGMLNEARRRLGARGIENVRLVKGDGLELLEANGLFDVIFSSWVLGYIPLAPFFAAASRALTKGGRLAFIVHKENSPREPLEIFSQLIARDPTLLRKRVAFDFPRGVSHVQSEMGAAGLNVDEAWEGEVVFRYDSPEGVLEHLLKSGAGTAFYDAVDPARRRQLRKDFLECFAKKQTRTTGYEVSHEFVACVARKS